MTKLERRTAQNIQEGLQTRCLGQHVIVYESVDSTNSAAGNLAQEGAPDGTLVLANEQTAGRGRLGRRWVAPPGTSLLFSLLFRPNSSSLSTKPVKLEARRAQGLTMVCGLGLRAAIRASTGLPAQLKWPNDILLSGCKAGGILSELGMCGPLLDYVIVGVGLNVNLEPEALPAGLAATSISRELGLEVRRIPLLQAALLEIEQRYAALLAGNWPIAEWAAALETIGKRLQVHTAQGVLLGVAEGVDEEGALLLRLDDGQLDRVLVGDVVAA